MEMDFFPIFDFLGNLSVLSNLEPFSRISRFQRLFCFSSHGRHCPYWSLLDNPQLKCLIKSYFLIQIMPYLN